MVERCAVARRLFVFKSIGLTNGTSLHPAQHKHCQVQKIRSCWVGHLCSLHLNRSRPARNTMRVWFVLSLNNTSRKLAAEAQHLNAHSECARKDRVRYSVCMQKLRVFLHLAVLELCAMQRCKYCHPHCITCLKSHLRQASAQTLEPVARGRIVCRDCAIFLICAQLEVERLPAYFLRLP